jgi:hypothetical protein
MQRLDYLRDTSGVRASAGCVFERDLGAKLAATFNTNLIPRPLGAPMLYDWRVPVEEVNCLPFEEKLDSNTGRDSYGDGMCTPSDTRKPRTDSVWAGLLR